MTQCSLVYRYQGLRAGISKRVVARTSLTGLVRKSKQELLEESARFRRLFAQRLIKYNPSVFTKRMCF